MQRNIVLKVFSGDVDPMVRRSSLPGKTIGQEPWICRFAPGLAAIVIRPGSTL
ncbi:hypothetical protein [Paraburkholderia sp. MM5482-R1]|uniref:hypothetical protein n=1 Tax=Paraburkholderia sp. MM5482-R1 TaxID=2991063 RepID=UPI003D25E76C